MAHGCFRARGGVVHVLVLAVCVDGCTHTFARPCVYSRVLVRVFTLSLLFSSFPLSRFHCVCLSFTCSQVCVCVRRACVRACQAHCIDDSFVLVTGVLVFVLLVHVFVLLGLSVCRDDAIACDCFIIVCLQVVLLITAIVCTVDIGAY